LRHPFKRGIARVGRRLDRLRPVPRFKCRFSLFSFLLSSPSSLTPLRVFPTIFLLPLSPGTLPDIAFPDYRFNTYLPPFKGCFFTPSPFARELHSLNLIQVFFSLNGWLFPPPFSAACQELPPLSSVELVEVVPFLPLSLCFSHVVTPCYCHSSSAVNESSLFSFLYLLFPFFPLLLPLSECAI